MHMKKDRADVVLVVGSGIHKFSNGASISPLSDWWYLLEHVAAESGAEIQYGHSPSIAWEQLLFDIVKKNVGGNNQKVSLIERGVRRTTSKIIRKCAEDVKFERPPAVIVSNAVGEIISLNFEASWYPAKILGQGEQLRSTEKLLRPLVTNTAESLRLHSHLKTDDSGQRRIWFPNGHWALPKSLRMGYRDFGLQPTSLAQAFKAFKVWETWVLGRKNIGSDGRPKTHAHWVALLDAWDSLNSASKYSSARTWVTAFMLRTPIFVGTGLSADEQGLWWLLCQRARNVARLNNIAPPMILKNINSEDASRVVTFMSRPFGLEVIWCRDWEDGWNRLEAKISMGGI
jgi:hypothetical protein